MEREITAITAQKRNPQRVNIYLDGEFAFGLSRFVAAWLKLGQKLSSAEIERLKDDDTHEIAFQKAMGFINYRPRSIEETRRRLGEKGFSTEVIEITLAKLIDKGWLNDLAFARQWIENRNTFRPRSNRVLAYELRLKGVADDEIAQALEDFGGDETELAFQAGQKKAQQYRYAERADFIKKVGAYLGRRGFNYGIVKPVVEQLWKTVTATESECSPDIQKMEQ